MPRSRWQCATRLAFVSFVGGWQEPEREEDRGKSRPACVITTAKYKFDGEGFVHDRRTHIFVVEARGDDWAGDIHVVRADGSDLLRLTGTAGPMWYPMWSPDGRSIVYVGTGYPTADGRNFRLFSVATDGETRVSHRGPRSPAVGVHASQLTNLNGPWKEEVRVSRPERFTFTRAVFDIDGWVMTPPGADPARRSPALLRIHGGPHREFGHYYSHEFQVYAGAGYTKRSAVTRPSIRSGSA